MVSSIKSSAYNKVSRPLPAHNPVVEGNFPIFEDIKELAVFKFNRFLTYILLISVIASMVSYSVVAAKENVVVSMYNKTNEINFENVELQNKVDYVRSFYNINDKISKISFLKKADKVIEVSAVAQNVKVNNNKNKLDIQPVPGY